jgi:Mrp family chromosome partitioning ATPase
MSVLDRAFIKAYRKANAAHGVVGHPHANFAGTAGSSGQTRSTEVATGGTDVRRWAEPAAAAVPAPHALGQASPPRAAMPAALPKSGKAAVATPTFAPQSAPVVLRPAFEVPKFPWPALCQALLDADPHAWNRAAEQLEQAALGGERLVLVTSRARGEGRTTLTICLARLLSSRGTRLALVDADFPRAELARRLRLMPQAGWENVWAGEPLEEALIESVADGVTLLPIKEPIATLDRLRAAPLGRALQALKQAHDLVLVETGPIEELSAGGVELLAGAARFDAALVVCDTRGGTAGNVDGIAGRLAAAGIGHWSVLENYAAA